MTSPNHNIGMHVLEEFKCQAIPASDLATPRAEGRGIKTGMEMKTELEVQASQPSSVPASRIKEFRAMTDAQLLELLISRGPELSGQELLLIHDIATERLKTSESPARERVLELLRKAMLAALGRAA